MLGKFDALDHGLYREFRSYGDHIGGGALLNTRAWNRQAERGHDPLGGHRRPVADCRHCGADMFALPTEVAGRITWYSAQCSNPPCSAIIASPNGEVLRRSSRHSEMPGGFWDGRPKKQQAS